MHIRVTTDPMSMREVENPHMQPCVYRGDGENGLEIYFESEVNRLAFIEWERDKKEDHQITLKGDSSADYVAEG